MINRERATDYLNTRKQLYVVDGFAGWDPEVPHQGPHHLLARVPRALHEQHAHPADARGARELRRARLRGHERRRLPGEPSHHRHDKRRRVRHPALRPQGVRHPRHRVRRGDEEGRLHDHALPDAEAGRALDALLGEREPTRTARRRSSSACPAPGRPPSAPTRTACSSATTSTAGPTMASSTSRVAATPRRSTSRPSRSPRSTTRSASARCSRTWSTTEETREVDYTDTSITQNTRCSYPIEYIPNAKIPCVGGAPEQRHPAHVRRVRRVAAGQQADARAGDVPLHQRLHGEGRGHRDGRDRSAGDVQRLVSARPSWFWHPTKLRRAPRREAQEARRPDVAREHGLDRRRLRYRASE